MKADLEAIRQCHRELDRLIGDLTSLGARRERLKARMFGGMRGSLGGAETTAKTIVCVRQFMREAGMPVVAEALGDAYPRLVSFSPASGSVEIKRLSSRSAASVVSKESEYFNNLAPEAAASVRTKAS
jgi:chemotaxis protein CheD